jgi:hypothetical protein
MEFFDQSLRLKSGSFEYLELNLVSEIDHEFLDCGVVPEPRNGVDKNIV